MSSPADGQNFSPITPAQCRAARALIGIKASDLAAASGLSLGTVKAFETGSRKIAPRSMRDLLAAFQREGVSFDGAQEADGKAVQRVFISSSPIY